MLKLLVANTQIASATRGNVDLARLFVQHCSALKPSRPGRPERLATYLLAFLAIKWGFDGQGQSMPFRSWAAVMGTGFSKRRSPLQSRSRNAFPTHSSMRARLNSDYR